MMVRIFNHSPMFLGISLEIHKNSFQVRFNLQLLQIKDTNNTIGCVEAEDG
jgi:hypothetical protein